MCDAAKSGQKFPCLKAVLLFFEIFFEVFWDFQWWKCTFFKKCSKNSLVSEKNYFIFSTSWVGIRTFFNPSLIMIFIAVPEDSAIQTKIAQNPKDVWKINVKSNRYLQKYAYLNTIYFYHLVQLVLRIKSSFT